MSGWLCDDTGDVDFTNLEMSITSGAQEAKQNLAQNLRTFLGEWFLDVTIGLPYFTVLFEKGITIETVKAYVQDTVLNTKGISGIEKLEVAIDPQTRICSIEIIALYGSQPISVMVTV